MTERHSPTRSRRTARVAARAAVFALSAALAAPPAVLAQSANARFGGGEPVTLNFVDAQIDGVARAMAAILNRQFVVDPRVKGTITLYSETPLSPREAYLTFIGVVRARKTRWTQDDWDYVDHVYSRLNDRKRQVDSALSTSDLVKIKTLQAEYLALEAGSDAKDLYQEVK